MVIFVGYYVRKKMEMESQDLDAVIELTTRCGTSYILLIFSLKRGAQSPLKFFSAQRFRGIH